MDCQGSQLSLYYYIGVCISLYLEQQLCQNFLAFDVLYYCYFVLLNESHVCIEGLPSTVSVHVQIKKSQGPSILCLDSLHEFLVISPSHLSAGGAPITVGVSVHCSNGLPSLLLVLFSWVQQMGCGLELSGNWNDTYMGWQHCRQQLNLLYHNATLSVFCCCYWFVGNSLHFLNLGTEIVIAIAYYIAKCQIWQISKAIIQFAFGLEWDFYFHFACITAILVSRSALPILLAWHKCGIQHAISFCFRIQFNYPCLLAGKCSQFTVITKFTLCFAICSCFSTL